jgi:putative inorganic carbon (HCO3(-)) transporter
MTGFLSLILFLLPSYLIRLKIFGFPTTALEVLVVVFLFVTVVRFKIKDLSKIKKLGNINYAIGLFILAGIISTIVSPEMVKALGQLKAFIIEPILLFYAMVLTIETEEQLQIMLRYLFWSAVILSGFGIFQYYSFIHLPLRFWGNGSEVERITSFFDYPNALSLFLAPLIGLFAALWVNKYAIIKNQWVSLAGLGVLTAALLLTFSRGAWVALAVGLFLILLQKYKAKKVIVPSVVLLVLLALIPGVWQRISLGISDPSSLAHFDLMQAGLQQIAQNPIFGNGLAGFATLNLGVEYPHNIILNFWVAMGLLGLVAFCWIVYLCYQKYKKNPARHASTLAGVAGRPQLLTLAASIYLLILITHGLVDVPYFKNDLSILFWFVVAMFYV